MEAMRDASDEMLARYILKNLCGYNPRGQDETSDTVYLMEILKEHRRQIQKRRRPQVERK